eukprot:m51a1_g1838 hypothetical protein (305) ;mRNA; r:558420-559463
MGRVRSYKKVKRIDPFCTRHETPEELKAKERERLRHNKPYNPSRDDERVPRAVRSIIAQSPSPRLPPSSQQRPEQQQRPQQQQQQQKGRRARRAERERAEEERLRGLRVKATQKLPGEEEWHPKEMPAGRKRRLEALERRKQAAAEARAQQAGAAEEPAAKKQRGEVRDIFATALEQKQKGVEVRRQKSERKREWRREQQQKKKQKKALHRNKGLDKEDLELEKKLRDRVEFGEVADQPPELTPPGQSGHRQQPPDLKRHKELGATLVEDKYAELREKIVANYRKAKAAKIIRKQKFTGIPGKQ